jgi:RES domain-containing protein
MVMLRLLASVLAVTLLAQPMVTVQRAVAVETGCAQTATHGLAASVVDEADCEGCDMPGCRMMAGCAGTAPAMTTETVLVLLPSVGLAAESDVSLRRDAGSRPPPFQPPKP